MNHKFEDYEIYNTAKSVTGETVRYRRRKCKCGHVLNFLSKKGIACSLCGRMVYPDARIEFKEKLKRKLKNEICIKV